MEDIARRHVGDQNPPVEPAIIEESYEFLLQSDIDPNVEPLSEEEIYLEVVAMRYLERNGLRCPNLACDSDQLSGGSWEADDNYVTRRMACTKCGASWSDGYILNFVADLELPEEDNDGI